jgi:hypothetical protein
MQNEQTELQTNQDSNTELVDNQANQAKEEVLTISRSELDRKIGEAVFKNKQKIEEQFKKAQAEKEGNWEELFRQSQQELEQIRQEKEKSIFRQSVLELATKNNLVEFSDVLEKMPDLETVQIAVDKLKNVVSASVGKEIEKRLSTPSLPKSKSVTSEPTMDEIYKSGDMEEYRKWKHKNNKR